MAVSQRAKTLQPSYEAKAAPQSTSTWKVGTPADSVDGADGVILEVPTSDDVPGISMAPDGESEVRHETIATAAYFLAQARGFEPGRELDDWLAAEQQINAQGHGE
jgi:hypothetical protein